MRAVVLACLAAVCGCGKVDPCAGHSGVCVGLRVEGNVKNLDQLAVSVDKPQPKTVTTAVEPITLPVAIALDLPASASGAVRVGVVGLSHGAGIAAGSTTVTLSGGRASAVVTLNSVTGGPVLDLSTPSPPGSDMTGAGGDMTGVGQGSLDMASCGNVTACVNNDNCCPSSCNGNTDNDCPSVCGNGVVEPNEVCDDGNTVGGDGCDPTCRWREALTNFSGTPGAVGHADGSSGITRWSMPFSMATDSTNLYVVDEGDCTVRKLSGSFGSPSSQTIAGSAWDCSGVLGPLTTARFNFGGFSPDIVAVFGSLYISSTQGVVLKVDLTANTVANAWTGITPEGLGIYGNQLVMYDAGVGLRTMDLTNGNVATVATTAAITAAGVSDSASTCHHAYCQGTDCYVACERNIIKVAMGASNSVTNYAGVYNAGTGHFNNACTTSTSTALSNLTFVSAWFIAGDGAGHFWVSDIACNSIVELNGATSGRYAGSGSVTGSGFVDQVGGAMAFFSGPAGLVYKDSTDIFVADSGNGVIRNGNSAFVYTTSGWHHNGAETLGASGTASNYNSAATGLASDGTNAYMINNGRLLAIALASGAPSVITLASPTAWPDGSAPGALVYLKGNLYGVNGNGVIQSVKTDGTGAAIYAGTANTTSPPSDGPRLTSVMNPTRLATDGTNLYFVDGGKEIRYVDSAGMVHTLAGDSTSTDYVDNTGTAAHFLRASQIACDGKNLYVADASTPGGQGSPGPSAIRRINIASGKVDTIAGSPSMTGHMDGPAASALFSGIGALASDGLSLFITDTETYSQQKLHIAPDIRQLDLATMNVDTMIGVGGQMTFNAASGTNALVHDPQYLTFDSTLHALFFFDNGELVLGRIK